MKVYEIAVWEAFVSVATLGSFSKAAERLRLTTPQVSKRVAKLEEILGVRLFQRTTRTVALTDEGKALLPKVISTLEDLIGIESSFDNRLNLAGTIRITSMPFVAHRLLIPVIRDFMIAHPEVHIELDLSEKILNLVESNFDIAVRIQEPEDSSLVYRKLVPNDLVFCASPKYLEGSPSPITKPEHLKKHSLLFLSIHRKCVFKNTSLKLGDFSSSRKLSCDNGWFLTELAMQDFGVLVRSIWDVRQHLNSGKLVQILKKHPLDTFGHVYAVVPSRRYLAPRVRVFLDYLVDRAQTWNRT